MARLAPVKVVIRKTGDVVLYVILSIGILALAAQLAYNIYTGAQPDKREQVVLPAPAPVLYRHTATGTASLQAIALARNTSVRVLEDATTQSAGYPGLLSRDELTAFEDYVQGGTFKVMPRGLVYYTYTGPAEG